MQDLCVLFSVLSRHLQLLLWADWIGYLRVPIIDVILVRRSKSLELNLIYEIAAFIANLLFHLYYRVTRQ